MAPSGISKLLDKQTQIVLFSSTAIALYGYDQGMMSLINTNKDYLSTMGIKEEDPLVGIIVSVYYLGCAVGAVIFSRVADTRGRKFGIFACLTTASIGNLIMFIAGLWFERSALWVMFAGRIVMGLGVGGIDSVVPIYTAELSNEDARGTALAKEFQANILGLNMAFIINVILTQVLGKYSQWAWRLPIILMQIFPALLFSGATLLPETPRWLVLNGEEDRAKHSIEVVFGKDEVDGTFKDLQDAQKKEEEGMYYYKDLLFPSGDQFHPTVLTIMGQINQALTGYGAVSVYGPQIFELLGFGVTEAEFITLGNYLFYFILMTLSWILIDRKGRRWLLVTGAFWLGLSFGVLAVLGGLAMNRQELHIPLLATGIPGIIVLYLATSVFGICWLVPPWLIPTEIYPSTARAQGSAVSVITWGLANFAVTLLTPIGFNNLKYYLFLVFAVTNIFAGVWTFFYCPESGNRSFEENQRFFTDAEKEGTWNVRKVNDGEFVSLPDPDAEDDKNDDEEQGRASGSGGAGTTTTTFSSSSTTDNNNNQTKDYRDADEREPLLGNTSSTTQRKQQSSTTNNKNDDTSGFGLFE